LKENRLVNCYEKLGYTITEDPYFVRDTFGITPELHALFENYRKQNLKPKKMIEKLTVLMKDFPQSSIIKVMIFQA
jgi:hypothetical protein